MLGCRAVALPSTEQIVGQDFLNNDDAHFQEIVVSNRLVHVIYR